MKDSAPPARRDPEWKTAERRCRRAAKRQGYILQRRWRRAVLSGSQGHYQLLDAKTGEIVAGDAGRGQGLTLEGVWEWLTR